MLQIKNTLGGGKPEGLYAWKKYEIGSELKVLNESVSSLPYNFYRSSAVVLNGEIHILGSSPSGNKTKHYKWDGSSWTSVSTLPYDFYRGSAVVLNGEIHILGSGDSSNLTKHYKWDGASWTSVSTLPYAFYDGSAVVFDNEIHILGGSGGSTKYYKWDGASWTSVSTLPYDFTYGSAVVFDNGIHTLGSGNNNYYTAHYLVYGYVLTYTFLGYIVSDKETAYPDGGEKGGYWYERVVEGIDLSLLGLSKSEQGSFTPTSNIKSYTINHNLGVKPKMFYLFREGNTAGATTYVKEGIWYTWGDISTTDYMYGTAYESYASDQYYTSETNNIKRDSSQIALSFNRYLSGSSEYKWMAFA